MGGRMFADRQVPNPRRQHPRRDNATAHYREKLFMNTSSNPSLHQSTSVISWIDYENRECTRCRYVQLIVLAPNLSLCRSNAQTKIEVTTWKNKYKKRRLPTLKLIWPTNAKLDLNMVLCNWDYLRRRRTFIEITGISTSVRNEYLLLNKTKIKV